MPADPGSVSPSGKPRKPGRDDPPTIEPAKPGQPSRQLIPIPASPPSVLPRKKTVSTWQYWDHYYRTHDEKPQDLKDKITLLNVNKKPQDVEAVLRGFLMHHAKNAEPWMYEALALAIKMNKGNEEDAKTAFRYAGDLAERGGNPNHLVSVADLYFINGYDYARVGKMLDQAAVKVPHRGEPLVMSINLAQKTKDPERMAASIDRLLSLGWPGEDDRIRRDARQQAETLAKTLREEGRKPEAETLLSRVTDAEARDVFVRMTWVGDADLDLAVDEPLGATARYRTPRTVFGGSIVKNGYGSHPEEVYVCPRGFDGDYTIHVETIYNNPAKPALKATIEVITHEGTPEEHTETHTIALGKSPKPVVVHLKGGRRTVVLPYVAPTPAIPAPTLASGRSRSSTGDPKAPKTKETRPGSTSPKPGNPAAGGQGSVTARPR